MGWILELTPDFKLTSTKRSIIQSQGCFNSIVGGVVGLNDRQSGFFASPRSSGNLHEKLDRRFSPSVVGDLKGGVGAHDSHEGDPGKIVSFGDHLRSDQYLSLRRPECVKILDQTLSVPDRIAVDADDLSVWKELSHLFFQALGSKTVEEEYSLSALGALLGNGDLQTAVVASQEIGLLVKGQTDTAMGALRDMTAYRANQKACEASSVQKEQRLFPSPNGFEQGFPEGTRQDVITTGLPPHVDHAYFGQGPLENSLGHGKKRVPPQLYIGDGLERGGG